MAITPSMTNVNLWNMLRNKYPQFASRTAKGTKELFSERGWEEIKATDPDVLNDFFGLSVRAFLQQVNVSRAVDQLSENDFGETYDTPYGGIIQRMAVETINPITPGYKGVQNGEIRSPFVTRKPKVKERFFNQNFDYQSTITVPSEAIYKDAFLAETGMAEMVAGIMVGLQNGYTVQTYENKLEAINAAINSVDNPLQETQKLGVSLSDEPSTQELTEFILAVKNLASAMTMGPQSKAYNAAEFATHQDKTRLRMLVRPGIKNAIAVAVMAGAFHPEDLELPFELIEVPHFGGLIPYSVNASTGAAETALQPIYDDLGEVVAYVDGSVTVNGPAHYDVTSGKWIVNVTSGSTTADTNQTLTEDEITFVDPNEDVLGIVADKGVIFQAIQNPYTVESIYNPRTMSTHYWANSPNNSIKYDSYYNLVAIVNTYTPET